MELTLFPPTQKHNFRRCIMQENLEAIPDPENIYDLVFYGNRALLGEVRPNMRKISIEYLKDIKTVILYIYFDKELTQEEIEYDIPGAIIAEICSDFPQRLFWKDEVFIIPYPDVIKEKGICIYRRYER